MLDCEQYREVRNTRQTGRGENLMSCSRKQALGSKPPAGGVSERDFECNRDLSIVCREVLLETIRDE